MSNQNENNKNSRFNYEDLKAEETLKRITEDFKNPIFASSFGAEDQVILDLIVTNNLPIKIFTLDTGRLPQETYDVIEESRKKYGFSFEILFPEANAVENMVREKGVNLFYDSVENRKLCCKIRKVDQLNPKLSSADAWVSGLRKAQSVTRSETKIIDWDEGHSNYKISPLSNWSEEQVWEYIKKNKVPYNKLHDQNYPSIGCAPCTRAIEPGEDVRAGRWWWEQPESKECGIHIVDGKIVRPKDL